jgi:uncharacterized protein (DUF433 family)
MTVSSHTERSSREQRRLKRAEAMVVCNREVMGGDPCIKGTRVQVYLIGALANAHGVRRTHEMYPFLTEEQIELAALYVKEHPEKRRRREPRLPKAYYTKTGFTKKLDRI